MQEGFNAAYSTRQTESLPAKRMITIARFFSGSQICQIRWAVGLVRSCERTHTYPYVRT